MSSFFSFCVHSAFAMSILVVALVTGAAYLAFVDWAASKLEEGLED